MESKIGIIAVAYNRVKSLQRLLGSLERVEFGAAEVDLIISIDKSDTDVVEKFADNYQWEFGKKEVIKHASNLGLKNHMLSLGRHFDNYDALVVLEDDTIVSPALYSYACQTVEFYKDNEEIAGISLYSFPLNNYTNMPFEPQKNKYDVFLMQIAQSWGEIWMKHQWLAFYEWYKSNIDFAPSDNVPHTLFKWEKSWLKYHNRYCIENNKYFVYPYHSISSNCGDMGIHAVCTYNNFQTVLAQSIDTLNFPSCEVAIKYDGFYEFQGLYDKLHFTNSECCLDLNGYKKCSQGKRFWITTQNLPYKIIKTYGLKLRPIEQNILSEIDGNEIFLYDTDASAKLLNRRHPQNAILYFFRTGSLINLIRKYGCCSLVKEVINRIFAKFRFS